MSIDDVTVMEGDSGTTDAVLTITATGVHGGCDTVAVDYATADSTAAAPADYTATSGTVTFTSGGGGTETVTVPVVGDTDVEGDEAFFVNISTTAKKASITDPQGTVVIKGDDTAAPDPVLTLEDASVIEGDTDKAGEFVFKLSRAADSDVTATYEIVAGTAEAGTDYKVAAATGTVTIPAGQTSATVPFTVVGDNVEEPDETFTLKVGTVTGAEKGDADAVATIVDDDRIGPTGFSGYRMVAADGGIFTFGDREFHGSTGAMTLNKPIVGGATDVSDYDGYWIVASDGGVFSFNAPFYGSLGDRALSSPAVEIEPTPTGTGYWIVQADGTVTAFGTAKHHGDMKGTTLNQPIIGMSVAPDGLGYWLVAKDGGIFTFGSAEFFGSMGAQKLNAPVIDLAPMPDGKGYYLIGADGGVFTFGTAKFWGSTGAMTLNAPVVAALTTPSGTGYWLAASDGGIFTFGSNIDFLGSMGGTKLNAPVLDLIN